MTKDCIRNAWDKSGLETKEGGSNTNRLWHAIKRAAPYKNEAVRESEEDAELFSKAMSAPLPCPLRNDFRAEVAQLDEDAPGLLYYQRELIRMRKQILIPEVYREATDFQAALRDVTNGEPARKKPKKAAGKNMHMHAVFADEEVRAPVPAPAPQATKEFWKLKPKK